MGKTSLFVQKQSGGMFAVSDQGFSTGNRFFVHSGTGTNGAGYGRNPDSPFATLSYALSSDVCTATKGDIIYVMPGHTESIAAASGCLLDIAGVKVQGLGWGQMIPTFTLTTAVGATLDITAANCWVENIAIVSNFLDVTASITVGASADGLTLKNLLMKDTAVALASLIGIKIAAAVSDVTIDGLRYYGLDLTADAQQAIFCAGEANRFKLINSDIWGNFDVAAVDLIAGTCLNVLYHNNFITNVDAAAGLCIGNSNNNTGWVGTNTTMGGLNATDTVTGTGLNYSKDANYTNAAGAHAALFVAAADS